MGSVFKCITSTLIMMNALQKKTLKKNRNTLNEYTNLLYKLPKYTKIKL